MAKSINQSLRTAFSKKQNIKIKYYSLSSDEVKWRIISIYKLENDFLIGYCHLRKDERTFVKDRIRNAIIQKEKYEIPKKWRPKSNVWSSRRFK